MEDEVNMVSKSEVNMVSKSEVNMIFKRTTILELMEKNQVVIQQVKGQRKVNGPPPDWTGPIPGPKTEIFIWNLPRRIYEETIYPFFSTAGKIYALRLLLELSGKNRGFCYVSYETPEQATNAIKLLHGTEIIPGQKVGVMLSINNCKLWMGRFGRSIKTAEIIMKICTRTAEVSRIYVYRNTKNKAEFALLEYTTHAAAATARRTLIPDKDDIFSHSVNVDWANPTISPINMLNYDGHWTRKFLRQENPRK
ncbi:probable RNA-binding protein 46 [Belonocnema kinseyi]|uniref:probable RNA-binding protein 46 n=1 Tax=Belonocnema kinseyi TaxID=2817044 RepID=UPI00143DA307|nr:probable RNA-binding protein 46 [Belonocnema kinseyi]